MTAADPAKERVFITGGAGFIGSHLVERLAATASMTVYDDLTRDALRQIELPRDVQVIRGDVLDVEHLAASLVGCDTVIHLAAIAGTRAVDIDARRTFEVNLLGTRNCLEAARRAGARRFVLLSTSEVYGVHADRLTEDAPTAIPAATHGRWGYAASKLAAEHLGMAYHRAGDLACTVIRPFNVYGPRQVGDGAVRDMVRSALEGGVVKVKGKGDEVRAWCFIDDFIDGLIAAMREPRAEGEILNIGNPEATATSLELAEMVCRLIGVDTNVSFVPASSPDVQLRIPSIDKARELLGYQPRIGLEAGVRRTIDWHRRAT